MRNLWQGQGKHGMMGLARGREQMIPKIDTAFPPSSRAEPARLEIAHPARREWMETIDPVNHHSYM
jgi:hypothetical protein